MILIAGAAILVALRFTLTSDLSIGGGYNPHDDSLYVERAAHLLAGEGFGPYDARVLLKYPGISLWLAGTRWAGIPFALSIEVLYIAAGLYLLAGLLKAGASPWVLLAALALYVLNPVTLGENWWRVLREPLDTGLLVTMIGAVAHLFARAKGGVAWGHLVIFSVAFAFSMFVREENRLLWALLVLYCAALLWWRRRTATLDRRAVLLTIALIAVPALLAKGWEYTLRGIAETYYGLPIIHDFGEGEFPRLMAAIRSVESAKDNRMVMVTQERLAKLQKEVPAFAPIAQHLPKPGPNTYSCKLHGVCSEWSNGWMPFWIKDAAFELGLTPSLPAGQEFFRRVRLMIEDACAAGRLRCRPNGDKFVPPMELRWIRGYVEEGYRVARLMLTPELHTDAGAENVALPEKTRRLYAQVGFVPAATSPNGLRASLRNALVLPHQWLGAFLLLAALAALPVRLWIADRVPLDAVGLVCAIAGLYGLFRLAILTYIAVYFGALTSRFVISTYAISILLAVPFIVETINAWRKARAMPA